MRKPLFFIVLALLVCSAGMHADQKRRKPVTHTVTIDATSYQPAKLTIAPGDSVLWVNKDVIPHTATAKKAGCRRTACAACRRSKSHEFISESPLERCGCSRNEAPRPRPCAR